MAFAEEIFSPGDIFLTPIEASWFFGCPLLGNEAVDLLAATLNRLAGIYAPFFPKVAVSGIRPDGPLARRLLRQFSGRFDLFLHSSGVQCAASLHGGLDGFLGRRSANHRGKLHKAARHAQREGLTFERAAPASPEEAEQTYTRMLAVEATSWKGLGRCGMAEPPVREFYGIMLRRLAETKTGRVMFARYGGRDIGFIFGGVAGDVYRGQQFSYDLAWKNSSVGNLLQVEQIRWLCEEGIARYDMGPLDGPKMEYKRHWAEEEMEIQTWVLVKR